MFVRVCFVRFTIKELIVAAGQLNERWIFSLLESDLSARDHALQPISISDNEVHVGQMQDVCTMILTNPLLQSW